MAEENKKCKKGLLLETKDLLSHKVYIQAQFLIEQRGALGLSDEQILKIRDLKTNLQKESLRNETEIEVALLELRNEIEKGKTNGIKVPSLIDKEYELKKKISKDGYNTLTEIEKILSAEQKQKAQALFRNQFKKSRYSKKCDPLLYQF
jgi:Spy/CpxP family protein refolding chaperone